MLTLSVSGLIEGARSDGVEVRLRPEDANGGPLASAGVSDSGEFTLVVELAGEEAATLLKRRPRMVVDVHLGNGRSAFSSRPLDPWSGRALTGVRLKAPEGVLERPDPTLRLTADGLERRDEFDIGESLTLAATGLRPQDSYDVAVLDEGGEPLFVTSLISNLAGDVEPTVVWPQIGLLDPRATEVPTLAEARERWAGRRLFVELRAGERPLARAELAVAAGLERPLLFVGDAEGRLLNAIDPDSPRAFVVGHNLRLANPVRAFVVPRQQEWRPGDRIEPARLRGRRQAIIDVEPGEDGSLRVRLPSARELEPGAYDIILRELRYGYEDRDEFVLLDRDLLVHRRLTGLVVRHRFMDFKTVRGGCVNQLPISGRTVAGAPYFQYADTFEVGEAVYGALDPAVLDPNHTGKMVALYVVPHKTAAEWSADTSLQHLPALGGNPAVQKFLTQPGCINFNKRLLWASAQPGEYDIVADFGNNSPDPLAFAPDASFDAPLDMIDGYFVTGFRVVADPTTETSFAHAGHFSYDASTHGSVTVSGEGGSFNVPVRGSVWFPADVAGATSPAQTSAAQANYPLVVVVHGNATQPTSYLGYEYLLEHLARNGFVAASIHLETHQMATDRARVLLHHIPILQTLFGAKLQNTIGLMGHSRGGEAVTVAARLNHDEGLGHNFDAIIALAPTDWIVGETYRAPWAVPYHVMYGAMDGDVAGPSDTGFELYDRASGADKSMVFAYGAIHDRFNTVWGDGDLAFGQIGPTDLPKLASADAHQKLAKGYMTAFFRQHLRGETQWEGMFRGEWTPAAVAAADPNLKLYTQYGDTSRVVVDDFEGAHTPTSWQTSTIGAAVDDGNTLPVDPQEQALAAGDAHSPHDTAGLQLRWNGAGDHLSFTVPAANRDVSGFAALSFRVAQKVGSPSNPAGAQNFHVTLTDTGGNSRAILAGKLAEIPAPQVRHFDVFTKSALRTVRIPLHVFHIEVLGTMRVDLENVESVTFDFGFVPTGEIALDSVEFTA